ncbi:MAG: LLM class F420-dependent oxidoreductase [Nocardioidaceae bacterium]
MDLRVFIEAQQGATYDDQLRVARAAEDLGYDAFFRSDHFYGMGTDGLPGPTDSWATLAALARETSRVRLGTLLTSVTFRLPGPLAIMVAQVDQMSDGRVDFGIGAGWFEREHAAYGIPFPPVRERFDRLEESLAVLTGLWGTPAGTAFSYDGSYYQLTESPALPKPVQSGGPPIILGGKGKKRTPELAARYADEFNMPFCDVETTRVQFARVRDACVAAGRDPDSLVWSNALTLCCGVDDAEVARRADAIGHDLDQLRAEGLAGTPDEIVQQIGEYAELGSQRIYLQTLDLADLDHLELVASRVMPQL